MLQSAACCRLPLRSRIENVGAALLELPHRHHKRRGGASLLGFQSRLPLLGIPLGAHRGILGAADIRNPLECLLVVTCRARRRCAAAQQPRLRLVSHGQTRVSLRRAPVCCCQLLDLAALDQAVGAAARQRRRLLAASSPPGSSPTPCPSSFAAASTCTLRAALPPSRRRFCSQRWAFAHSVAGSALCHPCRHAAHGHTVLAGRPATRSTRRSPFRRRAGPLQRSSHALPLLNAAFCRLRLRLRLQLPSRRAPPPNHPEALLLL